MSGETKAEPVVDIKTHGDPTDKLGGSNVNPKVSVIPNIVGGVDPSVETPIYTPKASAYAS